MIIANKVHTVATIHGASTTVNRAPDSTSSAVAKPPISQTEDNTSLQLTLYKLQGMQSARTLQLYSQELNIMIHTYNSRRKLAHLPCTDWQAKQSEALAVYGMQSSLKP